MSKTTKDRGLGKDGFVEFYRYNIAIACQLGIKLGNPVMLYRYNIDSYCLSIGDKIVQSSYALWPLHFHLSIHAKFWSASGFVFSFFERLKKKKKKGDEGKQTICGHE